MAETPHRAVWGLSYPSQAGHEGLTAPSVKLIAINKDVEAPIFELVDFGVVGDLFTVLPQATDAVKAAKG